MMTSCTKSGVTVSRVLVLLFEADGQEALYRSSLRDVTNMLRSKHGDNYLVST